MLLRCAKCRKLTRFQRFTPPSESAFTGYSQQLWKPCVDERMRENLFLWPILQPKNEFESRPDLINRADLYVHHSFSEANVAHHVFI